MMYLSHICICQRKKVVYLLMHLFGSHSMDVQQNNCSVPCENRWSCFPISRDVFLSLHSQEFRLLQSQN